MTQNDLRQARGALLSEIGLAEQEADLYLLINTEGRMSVTRIAERTDLPESECALLCRRLADLGAFIDMPGGEFEAMHPRFTAVNMYRRMCERDGRPFGRNREVDNIGVALERYYDDARTGKRLPKD